MLGCVCMCLSEWVGMCVRVGVFGFAFAWLLAWFGLGRPGFVWLGLFVVLLFCLFLQPAGAALYCCCLSLAHIVFICCC